jgi:hypothetical protein
VPKLPSLFEWHWNPRWKKELSSGNKAIIYSKRARTFQSAKVINQQMIDDFLLSHSTAFIAYKLAQADISQHSILPFKSKNDPLVQHFLPM